MKHWVLILVVMAGVSSCHGDDADPGSDLLYRMWRMTKIQYTNGQIVDVSSTDSSAIVTFKTNGMILYGRDGKYDPCCLPARFKRKGNTLDLVDVASIPMPERAPNELCTRVDCAPIGSTWQIDQLTTNELVVRQERVIITYQPYP